MLQGAVTEGTDVLLVIDMQNCYFATGHLAQHRKALIDKCNTVIERAVASDVQVVGVRTEHRRDRSTWTLNMLEDDQGFAFEGDDDAQFVSELDIADTTELVKTRDSAFLYTELDELLKAWDVSRLILCGVSTHSCIAATAADAYARNFPVLLVADAISSHLPAMNRPVLNLLHNEYRQELANAEQVVF